jgi:phosphatidylinositol alpha-1,6-mannosyltransferase
MRVLLCTPDFPPKSGGIQLLLDRLVGHSRHRIRVVTIAAPGSNDLERERDIIRTAPMPDHRAEVLALNLATLRQVRAWRPRALVCGHVVVAPAALAAQEHLAAPAVQYLYSDELRHRHALARFAVRRAAASIAISTHTLAQARSLGASPNRLHLIPPGVDLPDVPVPDMAVRASLQPTIVTVARMEDRYKGLT